MGMVTRAAVAVDAFALDAVKTYLRIDGASEDSALAALIATAVEQCEAYVGVSILQRAMTEVIVPGAAWQYLTPAPVRVISGVALLGIGGATTAVSRPISMACSAVNVSASSSSAAAFPAPTSRGSVQDRPESAVSPIPAKAVVYFAP